MKKCVMMTPQALSNLGKCFSGKDEVIEFMANLGELADEIVFTTQLMVRLPEEDDGAEILLRRLCVFTLFCRDYIELIRQLVATIDCKELNEEEMKKFRKKEE